MKARLRIIGTVIILCAISVMAGNNFVLPMIVSQNNQETTPPQDDKTRRRGQNNSDDDKNKKNNGDVKAQPTLDSDNDIPDSLINTRWKIQRTQPLTDDDLTQGTSDLLRPENLQMNV